MANFNKGVEAVRDAAKRTGGSGQFTPTIYWKKDEKKYIQFLQPFEDAITVDYHAYITVGYREDGKPIIREFVSPQDEQLQGSEGYDPIKDRFGIKPKKRTVMLAVELEPVTEVQENKRGQKKNVIVGFEPVMRTYTDKEGEEQEVPAVGLIIESPHTFYPWLVSYSDDAAVEDKVFSVQSAGEGLDKKFHFMPVGDAMEIEDLEIDEESLLDVEAHLEDLGSEERMREYIDPLEDDAILNRYAQKKGKSEAPAARKPRSTPSRRSRREEPEVEENEVDDLPEEEEAPRRGRSRSGESRDERFNKLRSKTGQS